MLRVRAALARLARSRAAAPKATLRRLASLAPLDAHWLDDVGVPPRDNDSYQLRWCGDSRTRNVLRILSGLDDLRDAQAWNAGCGAVVRKDWTASASRGVAIKAGEKDFDRVHTDGKTVIVLGLRSAAYVVAEAKVCLRTDVSEMSCGVCALQELVRAGVLVQDEDCKVRAGPKLRRLRAEISEDLTAADVLSFWIDCAFVSGRSEAHCIPGCWQGVYHWMETAWPLDNAALQDDFGVVGRVAALTAFHSAPEYHSLLHIRQQNLMWVFLKGNVLDDFFGGVYSTLIVRFYDPATGAPAARKHEFTRELVETILYGGPSERVRLSREDPIVRALLEDWALLSLDLEAPATGLRYGDRGEGWMLTERALLHIFTGRFEKDGSYCSTLMGGIRYALFARDAEGVVTKVLDKGSFLERDVGTLLRATAARDAACENDAVRDAARSYDASCARWLGSPYAPPLPDDAAIEAARRVAADRATAEAARRTAGGFAQRKAPRTWQATDVVPPEPGAPRRFVGVSWGEKKRLWSAEYKTAKQTRDSRNRRTLGYYPTDELAARARHKHICDEGLEQFNTMDVLDRATGLMVPREKKRRREEPVAAAPTRQSTRVRKAISRD